MLESHKFLFCIEISDSNRLLSNRLKSILNTIPNSVNMIAINILKYGINTDRNINFITNNLIDTLTFSMTINIDDFYKFFIRKCNTILSFGQIRIVIRDLNNLYSQLSKLKEHLYKLNIPLNKTVIILKIISSNYLLFLKLDKMIFELGFYINILPQYYGVNALNNDEYELVASYTNEIKKEYYNIISDFPLSGCKYESLAGICPNALFSIIFDNIGNILVCPFFKDVLIEVRDCNSINIIDLYYKKQHIIKEKLSHCINCSNHSKCGFGCLIHSINDRNCIYKS